MVLCHRTSGRTAFSYCRLSCPPRRCRQTQAGFVFSHSTPGRRLPFPNADCTLCPGTEPRDGGHRQVLYYRAAIQGGSHFFQLWTEPLTYHGTQAPGSPPPQVCKQEASPSPKKAPQLEIESLSVSVRGLSPVQIESCTSPSALSLPFVSSQKRVLPLRAHVTFLFFMSPSFQLPDYLFAAFPLSS